MVYVLKKRLKRGRIKESYIIIVIQTEIPKNIYIDKSRRILSGNEVIEEQGGCLMEGEKDGVVVKLTKVANMRLEFIKVVLASQVHWELHFLLLVQYFPLLE